MDKVNDLIKKYRGKIATLEKRYMTLFNATSEEGVIWRSQTFGQIRAYKKILEDLLALQ